VLDKTPLGTQIEDALKQEILSGNLLPGQRIDLDQYASSWGVSSTPIRDALTRLEKIGFVKVAPRRGVYVSKIDQHTFKETFDVRIALECMATELATSLIPDTEVEQVRSGYLIAEKNLNERGDRSLLIETDYQVHEMVLKNCGNQRLIQIMQDLRDMIDWARSTIISHSPKSYELALPEHLAIVESIRARDVDRAVKAMRNHLRNSYERTRSYWENSENCNGNEFNS
jgi:DNA-binding GntR family transcriptional regulator